MTEGGLLVIFIISIRIVIGMDLHQLDELMSKRRAEFEKAVSSEAKKLCLADVTKEIHLDPGYFLQRGFEDGQRLEFLLCQGYYTVSVDRQELVLRGSYDIKVAIFSGNEVRDFYDGLSTAILKAKEEDIVPF